MIQTHLYARNAETPVFGSPREDGKPSFKLHQGNWMGVVEVSGDWIHIITIDGEGWVKRENTEVRAPYDLHILLSEGLIDYVNSSPRA